MIKDKKPKLRIKKETWICVCIFIFPKKICNNKEYMRDDHLILGLRKYKSILEANITSHSLRYAL
jgi:hypothetical protein